MSSASVQIVECPQEYKGSSTSTFKIFLAGGITNCPDWQAEIISRISSQVKNSSVTIFNPRRTRWKKDEIKEEEQITWEHKYLQLVDLVVFWFPEETLCPIALYELGVCNAKRIDSIIIGYHRNYKRRTDVLIQSTLAGYKDNFYLTLDKLISRILGFIVQSQLEWNPDKDTVEFVKRRKQFWEKTKIEDEQETERRGKLAYDDYDDVYRPPLLSDEDEFDF